MAKKIVPVNNQSVDMMRYVLIVALVALLGFSIIYIYNVQKASKEAFVNQENGGSVYQVVYIYSNSCGYCTKFTPIFNEFASTAQSDTNLNIAMYEQSMAQAQQYLDYVVGPKCQTETVTQCGFPTVLIMNQKNELITKSVGSISLDNLKLFVKNATA